MTVNSRYSWHENNENSLNLNGDFKLNERNITNDQSTQLIVVFLFKFPGG